MILKKKYLDNILLFNSKKNKDARGFFMRAYCVNTFKKYGIKTKINQINISHNSKKHTLRGYHFQKKPYSEAKTISCIKGEIFFSVLDINPSSKFYLKTCNMVLNEEDNKICHVPKGYATAFLTMKNSTEVLYLMSDSYKPEYGTGIRFNDPIITEKWPVKPKIVSVKDMNFENFKKK
tara:strand:- start:15525 stop:16058 length:534 start_codon:yes stop_codon:yes gene_type:complete